MSDFKNTQLNQAFESLYSVLQKIDEQAPTLKTQLDLTKTNVESLQALIHLREETTALVQLSKQLKNDRANTNKLKDLLATNKQEIREIVSSLRHLDTKTLKELNIYQLILNETTSKILRSSREVNKQFDELKKRSVSITTLSFVVEKLADGVKKVFSKVLDVFGIGGGIAGAVSVLRNSYADLKSINRSAIQMGQQLGQVSAANPTQLLDKTIQVHKQNIRDYIDRWGLTFQESDQLVKEIAAVGLGSVVSPQQLDQLSDLIVDFNRATGISASVATKIAKINVHQFKRTLGDTSELLGLLNAHSNRMGLDFTSYANLVMKNTLKFEKYGTTLEQTSNALDRIYHSNVLSSIGFKLTLSQTERMFQTFQQTRAGANVSDNLLADIIDKTDFAKDKPFTVAMQDFRRMLMSNSPSKKTHSDLVEKQITKRLRRVQNENYMVVQMTLQTLGIQTDTTLAFAISEGFKSGKIKERFLSDLFPETQATSSEQPGDKSKFEIDQKSVQEFTEQMRQVYDKYAVDNIAVFQEKLFSAARDQAEDLEEYIQNLFTKYKTLQSLINKIGDSGAISVVGIALFGTSLAILIKALSFSVKAFLKAISTFKKIVGADAKQVEHTIESLSGVVSQKQRFRAGRYTVILGGLTLGASLLSGSSVDTEVVEENEEESTETTPTSRPNLDTFQHNRNFEQIKAKRQTNVSGTLSGSKLQEKYDFYGLDKKNVVSRSFHQKVGQVTLEKRDDEFVAVGSFSHLTEQQRKVIQDLAKKGSLDNVLKYLDTVEAQKIAKIQSDSNQFLRDQQRTREALVDLDKGLRDFDKSVNNELYRFNRLSLKQLFGHISSPTGVKDGYLKAAVFTGSLSSNLMQAIKSANPQNADRLIGALQKYSQEIGVPIEVLASQLYIEGGFRDHGMNSAGAAGYAQFIPGTWKAWGGGGNIHSPVDSVRAQARYMKYIYDYLSKTAKSLGLVIDDIEMWKFAMAGYNAGEGTAANYLRKLQKLGKTSITFADMSSVGFNSRENQDYVPKAERFLQSVNMTFGKRTAQSEVYDVKDLDEAKRILKEKGVAK